MPNLGPSAAALAPRDDLVLPCTGRDGVVREYRIRPCNIDELLDLMALDATYAEIGRRRWERIKDATGAQAGAIIAPTDEALAKRIARLMDSPLTAEEALALPLGPDVDEQMKTDGVRRDEYMLAVMTAQYWHLAGDEAARDIWFTGRMPGKPVAPTKPNSTSTASVGPRAGRSKRTTSPRKSKRGS